MVEINVCGPSCSGKTTIIRIIEEALKKEGIGNVIVNMNDNYDMSDMEVEINEVTTMRPISSDVGFGTTSPHES